MTILLMSLFPRKTSDLWGPILTYIERGYLRNKYSSKCIQYYLAYGTDYNVTSTFISRLGKAEFCLFNARLIEAHCSRLSTWTLSTIILALVFHNRQSEKVLSVLFSIYWKAFPLCKSLEMLTRSLPLSRMAKWHSIGVNLLRFL